MATALPPSAAPLPIQGASAWQRCWTLCKPYAQLVRLPNVFTAFADICLGGLAVGALPERWLPFGWLLLASGCLYAGGMVWNDFFDYQQDYRERPLRPLPSGKVSRRSALLLGLALLAVGFVFTLLAGWEPAGMRYAPAVLAGLLIGASYAEVCLDTRV